ncbi:plasmid pRiA4b ORF-3 family protein [Moorella sp. Hama-1]|uniref:plasmid pRiA4b ORF-3 family protein n=1 Tax=Moorella sp. Hama-1 TaxID=2138101 RepID=UPI000D642288|nr:plasmid pRiA4b ORF-3 family protein [Moorella sp. Hama-1]BCV20697.1 hypothetical protein hamaS1_07660 [Moorella sp. Hama-1]
MVNGSALANENIYQIKVTLKRIKPPIWRRVQVPGGITLAKLHKILQVVMGWYNRHLYQFTINGSHYGEPDDEFLVEVRNARRQKLKDVVNQEKQRFIYEYDFGDGWEHEIVVEKILPPEPGKRYPVCLKGKRACPPEDCGGPWGYASLLHILQHPGHPEYEDMRAWAGEDFDPEDFDLEFVNQELKTIK